MKWDLAKIYSFRFFDDLVLIYPFYALMFADFGTTPSQIGLLLGVWSVATFILEVPSGVAADKYSRKHILFIAQIIRACGYLIWIIFPTFWGFLAGFFLWGIKSAFTSGTYQALIYDLLKSYGKEQEYAKVTGRAKTLSYVAVLTASGGAALAIPMGYSFVLVLSIVAVLVAGVSILFISPARKQESTHEREYFSILREGFWVVRKEKNISRLIFFIAIVLALGGAIDEFFPIFANLTTIPKSNIALFVGVLSGSQALASFFAYRFENLSISLFHLMLIVAGLLFYLAAILMNITSLILLTLYSILYVISSTVLEARIQHLIPSTIRATVSSLQGFVVEIGAVAVYVGFGALAEASGYGQAFQTFGLIVAGFGGAYLLSSFLRGRRLAKS